MSTSPTPGVPQPATPTVEQKILKAAQAEEAAIAAFSPGAAAAIEAGVEVEPVISGLIKLVRGVFSHHAAKAAPGQ